MTSPCTTKRHVRDMQWTETFDYERLATYEDFEGRSFYVDTPGVEVDERSDGKAKAMLVCSDESYDGAICCFVDETGLRILRDVCTDLLGGYDD